MKVRRSPFRSHFQRLGAAMRPDQLGKVAPIRLVAGAAAFRREVELIPPLELGLWWEWLLVGFTAADQAAADG